MQIKAFSSAAVCLIMGLAIYVLFRPMTLLLFHWADELSLMNSVMLVRTTLIGMEKLIPEWFIFSLPFALWILSYLLFVQAIWSQSKHWMRFVWFWCVPLFAIFVEFAQISDIVPGSFDWLDLLAITLAIVIGFSATFINPSKLGEN